MSTPPPTRSPVTMTVAIKDGVDLGPNLKINSDGSINTTPVAGSGSNVAVTSQIPGVGATNLGKAEDAASASGDTGVFILGVRNDTGVATSSADGDYTQVTVSPSGQLVDKPYASSVADWSYAAATGGISNTTTAVTIKAAAGGTLKNYITGIDFNTDIAFGAATEVAIRAGAGGTVIWRTKIGTSGQLQGRSITFPDPLASGANQLLEVVTLTATVTGSLYFNATGYSGV